MRCNRFRYQKASLLENPAGVRIDAMPSILPANDWRQQLILGWHSDTSTSPIADLDHELFFCNGQISPDRADLVSSVNLLSRGDVEKDTLICAKELLAQEKKAAGDLQQVLSLASEYSHSTPDHVKTVSWRALSFLCRDEEVISNGTIFQLLNCISLPSENCLMAKYYMNQVFELVADWLIKTHKDISMQHIQHLANHTTHSKESFVLLVGLCVYKKLEGQSASTFQKSVTEYATNTGKSFATTSFPSASESREDFETFLASCVPCAKAGLLRLDTVRFWLEESLEKTFQSVVIMRSLVQVLSAIQMSKPPSSLSLQAEIIAAYRVFAQYTEKEKVQSHSESLDAGLLDTCSVAINALVVKENLKDDIAMSFLKSRITEMESLFDKYPLSGKLSNPLAANFIEWNLSLSLAYRTLCRISSDTYHIEMAFKYAGAYFPHVGLESCSDPVLIGYCYEYAVLLARKSQFKEALKITQIIVLKIGKTASSFKYWNFFLLLLSTVEENQSTSLGVAKKVDLELFEFVANCDLSRLSITVKRELLHLSMTCVAIFERANGVHNALDALSQVFALFRSLFVKKNSNETFKDEKPEQDGHSLHSKNDTRLKKKISHAFSHEKSKKKDHRHSKLPSSHTSSLDKAERKLLMNLWLWASVLYEKAGLAIEAESCVSEAETCYQQCSLTLSRMGMLVSREDPGRAIKLFESSLELSSEKNLESVLGLCQLYLNADPSSQDSLSALARLKFHLLTFTTEYDVMQVSEVYYCLSQIYERFGDEDKMVENLEKCLQAEQFRFIREVFRPSL